MLVIRSTSALHVRALAARAFFSGTSQCYSKDYASSSDDEKDPKKKKTAKKPKPTQVADAFKKTTETEYAQKSAATVEDNAPPESAATRLNRLLASMETDDKYSYATKQFSMAKPGEGNKKLKQQAKDAAEKKDVFVAAKRVAELIGDDANKRQTESELLSKLLGHSSPDGTGISKDDAANAAPTSNDSSELSLGEIIVGMKIDRKPQPKEPDTRADFVRRALASKQPYQGQNAQRGGSRGMPKQRSEYKRTAEGFTGSVNLFGNETLTIFTDITSLQESADILTTWAHLQQRELKLQVTHPPANYFDKMSLWTEQSKLWRFPIDNEQDLPEEIVNEDFSEHIFLEQHLESWCPNKGPIRHFMELVCVGLSKNPYITAREKKEHILWYRDYFEAKKDILKDLMSQEKMDKITAGKKEITES